MAISVQPANFTILHVGDNDLSRSNANPQFIRDSIKAVVCICCATCPPPPPCSACLRGLAILPRRFSTADAEASRCLLDRCRLFNLKLTATTRTFTSWIQQKRRRGNFLLVTGTTCRQAKELKS